MVTNDLGYFGKNGKRLSVDGYFQSNTLYAVKNFQRDHGLVVDGKVGDSTWKSMGLMLNNNITERLYEETMRAVYENVISYLPKGKNIPKDADATILYLFYQMVRNKGPLDLKQKAEWQSEYFIFDGMIVRSDAPGNIAYGIAGKTLNIDEQTLLMAAGVAQNAAGTSKSEWKNNIFYGDDPSDQLNIKIGFMYYDQAVRK